MTTDLANPCGNISWTKLGGGRYNSFLKYIFCPGVESATLFAQTEKLRMTVTKVFAGLSETRRGGVWPANWNTLLFSCRNVNYSSAPPPEEDSKEKWRNLRGWRGLHSHLLFVENITAILVLCFLVPWETGETFVTPLCTLGVFSPMQHHDFDTWFKNCLHAWFKHFLHSDTSRRAAASKQSTGYRSIAVY